MVRRQLDRGLYRIWGDYLVPFQLEWPQRVLEHPEGRRVCFWTERETRPAKRKLSGQADMYRKNDPEQTALWRSDGTSSPGAGMVPYWLLNLRGMSARGLVRGWTGGGIRWALERSGSSKCQASIAYALLPHPSGTCA
jgi:hypothetical protein